MTPRPENAIAIWLSDDRIMAFYLDGEILKRKSSDDGGTTWSDAIVVREDVKGFSAQYYPRERRIKGLTWRDFKTDETLGLIDIRDL